MLIERANRTSIVSTENMRVNLRGSNIAMAEQFLYRANISVTLQQVDCKAMPKSMATDTLDFAVVHGDGLRVKIKVLHP